MTEERATRILSGILSADVKGYSPLTGEDEDATIHTLTAYRGVIANLIQQYRGRVVDTPGDNILADFTSVVDAVYLPPDSFFDLKGATDWISAPSCKGK